MLVKIINNIIKKDLPSIFKSETTQLDIFVFLKKPLSYVVELF